MAMPMDVNLPEKWQADYERKTDGWDLGGPTPAFKRLVMSGRFKPGHMVVPGAGADTTPANLPGTDFK